MDAGDSPARRVIEATRMVHRPSMMVAITSRELVVSVGGHTGLRASLSGTNTLESAERSPMVPLTVWREQESNPP